MADSTFSGKQHTSPEAAALSRGSLAQQLNQQPSYTMTADQQIRAKALAAAMTWFQGANPDTWESVWDAVGKFELYIREGK